MGIQPNSHHIFSGLPPSFVDQLKTFARQVSIRKGGVIFKQQGPASHFFTLLRGRVVICIGRHGNIIHKVGHKNEGFGWSSLAGCDVYSASAVCIADTVVLKYEAEKLKAYLADKSDEALRFYQNLSNMLENRLEESRGLLASITKTPKRENDKDTPDRDCFDLL